MVGLVSDPPTDGYQISVTRTRGLALPFGAGFTAKPESVQVTSRIPIPIFVTDPVVVVVAVVVVVP
jgi:hypothetical protein